MTVPLGSLLFIGLTRAVLYLLIVPPSGPPSAALRASPRGASGLAVPDFTPFGDRFTIDVPGPDDLEMEGDLFDHEFTIRRGDQTVATISKRWFSMRDTYAVEVAAGQDDLLILASVLALDLAEDREQREH